MVYVAVIGSLFLVGLLIALNVRTNSWRNRRKAQRRKVPDRRVSPVGRRKKNVLEHESKLPDRRMQGDRRVGPATRRHKKRRAEDRLPHR